MNTRSNRSDLPKTHHYTKSVSKHIFRKLRNNFALLKEALDHKYGNVDYRQDARYACKNEFSEVFTDIVFRNLKKGKVLVSGANDGYEASLLLKDFDVSAVDLSETALKRLKERYKQAETFCEDLQKTHFPNDYFDAYICMRTVTSSNVNPRKAIREALRVTKKGGLIVYSIPNGYLVNDKLVKGMYITKTGKIDTSLPYDKASLLKSIFKSKGMECVIVEIPSEIILVTKKLVN